MINERIALVLLEGEVPESNNDPHYSRAFYKSMRSFAKASLDLWEVGNLRKFETYLTLAFKFFKEGNETVKNGVINVYLFILSRALEKRAELFPMTERLFPKELKEEFHRWHVSSAP